ncbi:MAG TPA: IPT/TIG domain-containing protein, partial [Verrucomicrobiae bacterium]|nr:IPT/TIG domain-containing protein [Verrucomicrobiae bacterium]
MKPARGMNAGRRPFRFGLIGLLVVATTILQPVGSIVPESVVPAGVAAASNPIVAENANAGTDAWQIPEPTACVGGLSIPDCAGSPPTTRLAERREIEGYGSLTSVAAGSQIQFMVSMTAARPYYMQIFRLGWYGGAGGRIMTPPGASSPTIGPLTGKVQPTPTPGPGPDYLIEANWPVAYTLTVPTSWITGYYVVKLIRNDGFERYIPFLVRNDASTAPILMQASVTTWQAYNWWGGKSLYGTFNFNTGSSGFGNDIAGPAAGVVSFDRPYATHPFNGWELEMVRYLERSGRDVTYASNVDVHANPNLLLSPRRSVFLSVGHDEYWSGEMRANVTNARDSGVNLAFFSGNAVYFRIRFGVNAAGAANRRIICYKNPTVDPLTIRWRDQNLPENALIGVMSDGVADNENFVVSNASSWVFAGSGLVNGSVITGLVGYEYDRTFTNGFTPAGLNVIAHSPTRDGSFSEASTYTASSGAGVFAAGTIQWASGLDSYRDVWANAGNGVPVSAALQTMTANILDRFSVPSPPLPTITSISPTNGPSAGGTVVTITGTGFSTTAGATTARFGSTAATGVSCSSTTSCSATSPAGSGTVDVTVTVGGLTSATSAADRFSYPGTPPT